MEEVSSSPFPLASWLGFRVSAAGRDRILSLPMRVVAHTVSLMLRGRHAVRRIAAGREIAWEEGPGVVHFNPVADREQTFVSAMTPGFESAVFVIPRGQFGELLESEGVARSVELHRILAPDDAVLRTCLERLAANPWPGNGAADAGQVEVSRELVLRLATLCSAPAPDWRVDESVFTSRFLGRLAEHLDAHLHPAPSLADMARLAGLSPSHFARKFRRSTGASLGRFVNRRRLRAALPLLADGSLPLGEIARTLGFSSQSHFTRLFSGSTGITPARYRRLCGPTVG